MYLNVSKNSCTCRRLNFFQFSITEYTEQNLQAQTLYIFNSEIRNISNQINLKAGCAIHIDTGMNRLGLDVRETENIVRLARNNLDLSLIMSHLSCSENKLSKLST